MSLKDIAHEMIAAKDDKPVKMSKHTIYVNDQQYCRFIEVCKQYNKKPSEIIDKLIESYLEEVDKVVGGLDGKSKSA